MSEQSPAEKAMRTIKLTPLFFDLETMRHPRVEEWVEKPVPDVDNISAPSNWKNPEKIDAYIQKAQVEAIEKAEVEYEQKLAKAPLDADLGAIRAIGYRQGVEGTIQIDLVPRNRNFKQTVTSFTVGGEEVVYNVTKWKTEAGMVDHFWDLYRRSRGESVGYNSIGFDLPYLMRRSMELEIRPLKRVDLRRYQIKPSTDLMGILYNWGRAKGLKFVCQRYGIENPNPDIDGSMVQEMTDAEVVHYLAGDIHMTTELWKLMWPVYLTATR